MATIITLGGTANHTVKAHRVYKREKWSLGWIEMPEWHCLEATWSAAPSMPTATLSNRYGTLKRQNATSFSYETKDLVLFRNRDFVKIEFDDDDGTIRYWLGVIELTEDQLSGAPQANGEMLIHCYGMEKLLAEKLVVSSFWLDVGPATRETSRVVAFNYQGRGNRTPSEVAGAHIFAQVRATSVLWTTRSIVKYLLTYQAPRDDAGGIPVTFSLATPTILPDWDNPEIDPDQQSVYSVLSHLVDRRRLLVWHLAYDSVTNSMQMKVNTLTESAITLPVDGDPTIPANTEQIDLRFETDRLTTAALKKSGLELVDQVIVRGARRISVGSFNDTLDATLDIGWTGADETAYELGASAVSGYANMSREEKQKRNAEVRDQPKLEHVYSRLLIPVNGNPPSWNRKVRNGEGGAENPLFPVDDGLGGIDPNPYRVFFPTMFVQPTLPLLVGVDYTGDKLSTGLWTEPTDNREELTPLVFFKRPGASPARWVLAEHVGDANELERVGAVDDPRFSCHVYVPPNSQGVTIKVTGAPQFHVANTMFTALADDPDPGDYDLRDAIYTIAIEDDRYVEGKWPETLETFQPNQVARIRYIYAGERYRQIYVAPGTVLGVDTDGTLKRSTTGGFIPKKGTTDDATKLKSLAMIAYHYYGVAHNVLVMETKRQPRAEDIEIGKLVTKVADPGWFVGTSTFGTASAHTSGSPSTTVTLTNSPDLSGVDVGDIFCATRNGVATCANITAVDDVGKTVTCDATFNIPANQPADWVIHERIDINAVITQITIQTPESSATSGSQVGPRMVVVTWAGELDPIQLVPGDRPPEIDEPPDGRTPTPKELLGNRDVRSLSPDEFWEVVKDRRFRRL